MTRCSVDNALFDWQRFTTLAADEGSLGELIDFFLEYASTELAALRSARTRCDAGAMREIAHRLGGSAGTAGAHALAAPLVRLEESLLSGASASPESLLAEAEAAFASIASALRDKSSTGANR